MLQAILLSNLLDAVFTGLLDKIPKSFCVIPGSILSPPRPLSGWQSCPRSSPAPEDLCLSQVTSHDLLTSTDHVSLSGWDSAHRLTPNSYWVLRLPYVYWGEGGAHLPPPAPPSPDAPSGCLLRGAISYDENYEGWAGEWNLLTTK